MLTKKEKERTWERFLALLRPSDAGLRMVIPEEDTFDPDTFGGEDTRHMFTPSKGVLRISSYLGTPEQGMTCIEIASSHIQISFIRPPGLSAQAKLNFW